MDALAPKDFFPQRGERAFYVGTTGGGKTALVRWMLPLIEVSPIVIYDTKEEPKYLTLERARVVELFSDLPKAVKDKSLDYVIYRPALNILADKVQMDNLLWHHYHEFRGVGLAIDELTDFTNSAKPGPGLLAIVSRGRSRAITSLFCTQRPAWIPLSVITEAQKYFIFAIKRNDMEKMENAIPGKIIDGKRIEFGKFPEPEEFGFWFYGSRLKEPRLFKKIPLDSKTNTGYVDELQDAALRHSLTWL